MYVCIYVCMYVLRMYVCRYVCMRGNPKIPGIVKKTYLWYSYKFENLVPFKVLPQWLDAAIPVPLPLLDTLSSCQGPPAFFVEPLQHQHILIHLWEQNKVERSKVRWVGGGWNTTTILFVAKTEAFCRCCRGSTWTAGGPWQHFQWRF